MQYEQFRGPLGRWPVQCERLWTVFRILGSLADVRHTDGQVLTLRIGMAPVTRSQAHQQEHGKLPEQMQDPLSQVGPDIMLMHVFGILEPVQLARCMLVCKDWQSLAKLDPLWGKYCEVSLADISPVVPAEQVQGDCTSLSLPVPRSSMLSPACRDFGRASSRSPPVLGRPAPSCRPTPSRWRMHRGHRSLRRSSAASCGASTSSPLQANTGCCWILTVRRAVPCSLHAACPCCLLHGLRP